jgi:multiple sugar transport system substrate-binding protein
MLASGGGIDLAQVNDDYVVVYTKRGLIQPLTKFLEGSILKAEDMYPPIWDFNWYDGNMMAFSPVNKVRFIVYNKGLLEEAGLAEPPKNWANPDWNWDTLLEYAQKLTKKKGKRTTQWGIAMLGEGGVDNIWPALAQGEGLFAKDGKTCAGSSPEGIEAFRYLGDLTHVHGVQPLWGEISSGAKITNLFQAEQVAMMLGGSWSIQGLRDNVTFEWDVAPIPIKPGKPEFANQEGSLVCYAIPKLTDKAEVSWKLIEFLGTEKAQRVFAERGFVPINKAYAAKYFIQEGKKPDSQQVVLDGMEYHQSVNFTENTDVGKKLFRVWLHKVWAGEMDVEEALLQAKIEVEEALAKE